MTHPHDHSDPAHVSLLEAVDVSVSYDGETLAVEHASFCIDEGDLVAVVGANGSGKSTLFKALAGFVNHDGDVIINGRRCHHLERQSIAYIPQQSDIDLRFPITVAEVVAAGRRRFHGRRMRPGRADAVSVSASLAAVDLAGAENTLLSTLSGGQVQRVLIARAIAQEASVMLLDESMSGVDERHVDELMALFADLCASGTAILVSTHDLALVRARFPRCLTINRRVLGDGDPSTELAGERLERLFSRVGNGDAGNGA